MNDDWPPTLTREWLANRFANLAAGRRALLYLKDICSPEFFLARAEFLALIVSRAFRGAGIPRGDGHPVLVLPGYSGGDFYLTWMRNWLKRIGYLPVKSRIVKNPGWSEQIIQELCGLVEREFRDAGRRLTIIGHSMGGVFGWSIARRRPEHIRHLIALGSPLALARRMLDPEVAITAIYSRSDRNVLYPQSLPRESHANTIEVSGTHAGLATNRRVFRVLASLLRRPDSACR